MKLWSIAGNSQKLDGGSMFGNAPRAMWTKWATPDDLNRIPLATRGLLATPLNGKTVLFETGIGAFFEPRLRARFGVQEDRHVLLDSLREAGFDHTDIDVVVLSHLHFDHAGGLLAPWVEGRGPELLFPTATFVVTVVLPTPPLGEAMVTIRPRLCGPSVAAVSAETSMAREDRTRLMAWGPCRTSRLAAICSNRVTATRPSPSSREIGRAVTSASCASERFA